MSKRLTYLGSETRAMFGDEKAAICNFYNVSVSWLDNMRQIICEKIEVLHLLAVLLLLSAEIHCSQSKTTNQR